MNTGVLDVLENGHGDDFALDRHGINFDLLGVLHELGNYDRVPWRDVGRLCQISVHFAFGARNAHRGAVQDVGWADQHGVADLLGEGGSRAGRSHLAPRRLVDADLIERRGKLVAVFGAADVHR